MPTDFPTQQQMNAFGHALMAVVNALPRIGLLVLVALLCVLVLRSLVFLVFRLLDTWRLFKAKPVYLELTPYVDSDKSPAATQKLYAALHGLQKARSWQDKLLQRRVILPLEIAAGQGQGIRFIARTTELDKASFQRDLAAHVPDLQFTEVADYLPATERLANARVLALKQTREFVYPLATNPSLKDHDPVTFLLNAMTQLSPDELISVQLIISPVRIRHADRLAAKVLHNELRLHTIGQHKVSPGKLIIATIGKILWSFVDIVSVASHGSSSYSVHAHEQELSYQRQVAKGIRPARNLGMLEQQKLAEPIYDKLSQQLFRVDIRVLIAAHDADARAGAIRKAFGVFDDPQYQALEARRNFPQQIRGPYRRFLFRHRLPSVLNRSSCVLSAAELSALYHFPSNDAAKAEDMAASLSRTAAAPLAVKQHADAGMLDVVLGQNHHHGTVTAVGLTTTERQHHAYIIGGTGNGKTTMLQHAIIQDIRNGKGVAVVDPHGDLAERILRYIPEERLKDVIYFDPHDTEYPIGINLLDVPAGLSGDQLRIAQDFVVDAVVSLFRKIFSEDDSGGHRIENTLRFAVHTAFTVPDATLLTVRKLLINSDYRQPIVTALQDESLKEFWLYEFGMAGNYQKFKKIDGVTSKIGRFEQQLTARRVIEQAKSTIDFDDVLNGKILICNLAKGRIGVDTSELFGTTILAELQLAAYRRIAVPEEQRRPFYLYVDEFQNFATTLFTQILSESRKYGLYITMAEQSTSQQEPEIVQNILANTGTMICFRTANPADEALLLHQFTGVTHSEIPNLSAFNFIMRIAAEETQRPFTGKTMREEDPGSGEIAEQAKEASRKNYAIKYEPKPQTTAAKPAQPAAEAEHTKQQSTVVKTDRLKGHRSRRRGSSKA